LTSYLSIFIFTFLVVPFRELQDTQTLSQGDEKLQKYKNIRWEFTHRDPRELAKSLSDKIDVLQTDIEDALLFTIGGESDEYRRAMRHVSCEFLRDLHHRVLDKIVQGTYPNPSKKES